MSACSTETGAKFVFDEQNMGVVARLSSHSTTSQNNNDSKNEMTVQKHRSIMTRYYLNKPMTLKSVWDLGQIYT